LSVACDQDAAGWQDLPACRTSPAPSAAVWGDSYAMQWVEGVKIFAPALVQLTRSTCPPIPGVAPFSAASPGWSEGCAGFNDEALRHILETPTIRYVFMSSQFENVLLDKGQLLLVDDRRERWSDVGQERLAKTLALLKAAGKVPVLIAPPPRAAFDLGACNVRQLDGLWIGGRSDCTIAPNEFRTETRLVTQALAAVAAGTGARLLQPGAILCRDGGCETRRGDILLYRDAAHLTTAGARFVFGLLLRERP
jgi:hypothetical protein